MKSAHKVGAVFYVLWGIFHTYIGVVLLQKVLTLGTHGALAVIGNALPPGQISEVNDRVMNGVLEHYAWNLVWFGAFAIVLAVTLNWRNSAVGYWFNFVVVGLTDIGFVVAVLLPGYITFAAGATGPILWILALLFTTLGRLADRGTPERYAAGHAT